MHTEEYRKHQKENSWDELLDVMAAVGNHEGKGLTLLAMTDDEIYTNRGLHKRLSDLGAFRAGPTFAVNIPYEWCFRSMGPVGLVADEVIDANAHVHGYAITEYGHQVVPLVGHLGAFSRENPDISLYDLAGSTQSNAEIRGSREHRFKRSPRIRIGIYDVLTESNGVLYASELSQKLEERGLITASLYSHLDELAASGIVAYETLPNRDSYRFYRVARELTDIPPDPRRDNHMVRLVVELLNSGPDAVWTARSLLEELKAIKNISPEEEIALKRRMSRALAFLAREDFLDKKDMKDSLITVGDNGKKILLDYLTILRMFSNGDRQFLLKGDGLAHDILSSPQLMAELMEKSYSFSRHTGDRSQVATKQGLIQLIYENPGVRSGELFELFCSGHYRISHTYFLKLLRDLKQGQEIRAEDLGRGFRYFV